MCKNTKWVNHNLWCEENQDSSLEYLKENKNERMRKSTKLLIWKRDESCRGGVGCAADWSWRRNWCMGGNSGIAHPNL